MRQVLITGATGQLGTALQRCSWPAGWRPVAVDRVALDLRDVAAIRARVAERPWAAIVNAAAHTAVDRAETDVVEAWAINALAPAALAAACVAAAIPLLHVSTDYVFDGNRAGAREVGDPVAPLGVYGASKLGGELAVRTSGARHAIVRTAWVVSPHGRNFLTTMLRLAETHPVVRVVDDQRGSPTSAAHLARALVEMTRRLVEDADAPTGTFHYSGAGSASWAEVAAEIFRQSAARGGPSARVLPIPTSDYPTPARRPANSLLSHAAIRRSFAIEPVAWQDGIGDILDDLLGRPAHLEARA